jgi:hypothetical protein
MGLHIFFILALDKLDESLGVLEVILFNGLQYGYFEFILLRPHGTFRGNLQTLIHFSLYHLDNPDFCDLFPEYLPPRLLYSLTNHPFA